MGIYLPLLSLQDQNRMNSGNRIPGTVNTLSQSLQERNAHGRTHNSFFHPAHFKKHYLFTILYDLLTKFMAISYTILFV